MQLHVTDPLFAWARLEDHPSLATLAELLALLPDEPLLDGLRKARGKGRDDFPVEVLWGVVVFTVALRHPSFESCLAELARNPALCRLLRLQSVEDIPHPWNVSRFLDTLGREPHLGHARDAFDALVRRLGVAVPDLGADTAGDSTALNARPKKDARAVAEETEQGLPQPSGGRKEYKDDDGNVTEVLEWFGLKLHLLVCVKHEVPLAYRVTDTRAGDNDLVGELVGQARANLPAGRIRTLAYDKAADDIKVHALLHQAGIKPLIQARKLWKSEPERRIPEEPGGRRYPLNVVHDEAGTVYCYDVTGDKPVVHQMAYIGYEKDRGELKYRCPALHQGWECPSASRCNEGKKYGLSVRVPCELDLRRFPPVPRATKQFEREYKGRTSVERVNARAKVFWGVDDGNVTGARRFFAYVGVVMLVCVAFGTLLARTPRREGSLGGTRLGPVARALREQEGKSGQGQAEGAPAGCEEAPPAKEASEQARGPQSGATAVAPALAPAGRPCPLDSS